MSFSAPIDRYQLVRMEREDYARTQPLPPGYSFALEWDREAERELLQSEFPQWEIPFNRQLPGLLEDGAVCVVHEGKPVGLTYFCGENEAGLEGYAQVHYAVVHPEHRGNKLLACMVTEAFRRWPELKGGVYFTDRSGHLEMYQRWGGRLVGEKEKQDTAGATRLPTRIRRKLTRTVRRLTRRGS